MSISTMIMDDPVPDHGPPEHRVHRLDARALEVADDRGLDAGGHGFVGHLDQSQLSVADTDQSQPTWVSPSLMGAVGVARTREYSLTLR